VTLLLPPFVKAVSSLRNQLATSSSRWCSGLTVSVTCEVSASGGSTPQEHEQILRSANAIIEAAKAEHIRQEAMIADLASAQAAITESINQAVNDAIANALRPVVCCTPSAPEPEYLRLDVKTPSICK
jgi:hypothetical protein